MQRDATWASFIDTPAHPEYQSAHSILAAAVGTVLQAEVGSGAMPLLPRRVPRLKARLPRTG